MKSIRQNQNNKWIIGLVLVFIGLLMLISSMPMESIAVPPGNVDSGNYVLDNHDTHIAYYNFNDIYSYYDEELEDDIEYVWDDSGRDKKGFLKNDVSSASEKDNNINGNAALSFNGNNQYVYVNDSSDFDVGSRNFVISALIKTSSEKSDLPICSKLDSDNTNGFTFYIDQGKLGFKVWDSGSSSSIDDSDGNDLRDGSWHFIALEIFQNEARLYVDPTSGSYGQVEVNTNFNNDPGYNDEEPFFIGREGSDYYEGTIDFVYFYAIETSYLTPPTRNRMWGLENVGYWPMDEGLIQSIPSDRNYINDMARSDFHSYGIASPGTTSFASSNNQGNTAPGTHCLQCYGSGGVRVYDTGNYLDFNCGPSGDDLYIELWTQIEDIEDNMMLIEKWDWLGNNSANGYRLYVDYDNILQIYNLKLELASNTITTLTLSGVTPGYWYHIWAWSNGGTMNLYYDSETQGSASANTANTNGIGATSNDLYFACGHPSWITPQGTDWQLVGLIDDVVIGRCYPV